MVFSAHYNYIDGTCIQHILQHVLLLSCDHCVYMHAGDSFACMHVGDQNR